MNVKTIKIMPDFCSRRYPFHYVTALNTLKKMDIDIWRVNLLAVGRFENYKGEVHGQDPAPGTALTPETEITLQFGCLSAVDQVPYQFFYGLGGGPERSDEWETRARELMAPFDSAVTRQEASADYQARRFNFGYIDREHILRFLDLFHFSSEEGNISPGELLFWASALPAFHMWSGNPEAVAEVLGCLIAYPVRIDESIRSTYEIPESYQPQLGKRACCLGESLVLGRSFSECDSTYEVVVEEVDIESISSFLPGGMGRRKLEWLLDICMPSNLDRRIRVKTAAKTATIGKGKSESYLGFSTYA